MLKVDGQSHSLKGLWLHTAQVCAMAAHVLHTAQQWSRTSPQQPQWVITQGTAALPLLCHCTSMVTSESCFCPKWVINVQCLLGTLCCIFNSPLCLVWALFSYVFIKGSLVKRKEQSIDSNFPLAMVWLLFIPSKLILKPDPQFNSVKRW